MLYSKHYVPFGDDCDTNAANKKVMDKGKALLDYLNTQQERIFANVVCRRQGNSTERQPSGKNGFDKKRSAELGSKTPNGRRIRG